MWRINFDIKMMGTKGETTDTVTRETKDTVTQPEEKETLCGIGPWRPQCLQCCAHLLPFSFIFGSQTLITNSLSFYLSSQITTIEKQFDISSTDTGIILAGNDIGFLLSVLLVSYLGHR